MGCKVWKEGQGQCRSGRPAQIPIIGAANDEIVAFEDPTLAFNPHIDAFFSQGRDKPVDESSFLGFGFPGLEVRQDLLGDWVKIVFRCHAGNFIRLLSGSLKTSL